MVDTAVLYVETRLPRALWIAGGITGDGQRRWDCQVVARRFSVTPPITSVTVLEDLVIETPSSLNCASLRTAPDMLVEPPAGFGKPDRRGFPTWC